MKTRTILVSLVAVFAGLSICYAADANMGTWKLNEAKSKFADGATRNHSVIYAATGDMTKVTVNGIDKDGKVIHNEWTGKFDGKDYPVTGDAGHDMRSYTRIDDRTLELTNKKAGKTVMTGKVVLSADGKTRTVTTKGADGSTTVAMYDKE